jgi:WD40 repeat protein
MSAKNINAFCIDREERWAFAGNKTGQVVTVDLDDFRKVREEQLHAGTIQAMQAHPELPLIATLGKDHTARILEYDEDGRLRPVLRIPFRYLSPDDGEITYKWGHTESQALNFHPTERRLLTRTGNAGVLEVAFDDRDYEIQSITRAHEQFDVVNVAYVRGTHKILSGARGHAVLIDSGELARRWDFPFDETIHWFEHLEGSTYLLASDARLVVRLDVTDAVEPLVGEPFARDHMEHVTFNHTSGRAYASSFDRNVYEIDPETCLATGVAFAAPFKLRWIKTLEREPSVLIAQCRDGGLHRIELTNGTKSRVIKETPDALWTAVPTGDGEILVCGEGSYYHRLIPDGSDDWLRTPKFRSERVDVPTETDTYTKRMEAQADGDLVAFARTDGEILAGRNHRIEHLVTLPSAVRDIALAPSEPILYAVCEHGGIYKIDADSGDILASAERDLPVWALALNPARNLLALGERFGSILFYDADTLELAFDAEDDDYRYVKRMKWLDDDVLYYTSSGDIRTFDLRTREAEEFISLHGNTIEDFDLDASREYLIAINYRRHIHLVDFKTGDKLFNIYDQVDYSKGIRFLHPDLNPTGYPLDAITYGRAGKPFLFRVHDARINSIGPIEVE